jgi:hypothetical protein
VCGSDTRLVFSYSRTSLDSRIPPRSKFSPLRLVTTVQPILLATVKYSIQLYSRQTSKSVVCHKVTGVAVAKSVQ